MNMIDHNDDDDVMSWVYRMFLNYPYIHDLKAFRSAFTSLHEIRDILQTVRTSCAPPAIEEPRPHALQSLEMLLHLRSTYPKLYMLYVAVLDELHPDTKVFRDKIRRELNHLQRLRGTFACVVDFVRSSPHEDDIPAKVENSRHEVLTFVTRMWERLQEVPRLIHHGMWLSSVPRRHDDDNVITDVVGTCFQDIYFLEVIVHAPIPQTTGFHKHWVAIKVLEKVYQQMYGKIMDERTWTTIVTKADGSPALCTHPFLPHPEDFVYWERPWKNVLRKRSSKYAKHILYSSPPLPINRFMTWKLMSLL